MKRPRFMIRGVLALVAWLGIGVGVTHAAVILPVDLTTRLPIGGSAVTVSIFQGGVDVTGTWLPEPGQTVDIVVNGLTSPDIVVNGLTSPTLSLVFDAITAANPIANLALTTSAYPGQCTNFDNPSPLAANSPDFTLSGNQLTATDCGGMAVILVNNTYAFILPQDSDFDGMPDIWEARFGTASGSASLTAATDEDTVAVSGAPIGDGIANFDEYRGFIVSGAHVRTHPRQKDLFVHLVNPQCSTLTSPGSSGSLLTIYPTDGTSLFANLSNLISGTQVHLLGYTAGATHYTTTEWVDNFVSYSVATGFTYNALGTTTDRQINKNALYPVLDTLTNLRIQKGLRITECLDDSTTSPLGIAGRGSPNGPDNAILYTQRIFKFFMNPTNGLIPAGGGKPLKYSTFVNGAWQTAALVGTGAPTDPANSNFIISRALQFYLAMEVGHAVQLTPTVISTSKTSYGYHYAPYSGDNLDQAITTKVDSKANTFWIPSLYNSTDQGSFRLKD